MTDACDTCLNVPGHERNAAERTEEFAKILISATTTSEIEFLAHLLTSPFEEKTIKSVERRK